MLSIIKKRLGVRILVYLMLVVAVFGLLMGYYVYRNSNLRSESEKKLYSVHGKTLIRNFTSSVTLYFGVISRDSDALLKETESLFADPTVSYVVFYDESSETIFERYREGIKPGNFKFSKKPAWKGVSKEIVDEMVRSEKGIPYMDFCAKVDAGTDEGTAIGWVRIGISLGDLTKQVRRSRVEGYALIGALLILGLFLVMIIIRLVMPPINRLAQAARRIGQGDFDVQVEVKSEDEIGLLTKTFNEMVSNIQRQTTRSESLIETIAQAVKLLGDYTSRTFAVVSEQATGATEQASVVQEVVSTTDEIAATAARISETSATVSDTAKKTSEVATKGKEYINDSISGMGQIHDQVERVIKHILELANQAQEIGGVIDIIEEISQQTNLLALNASIEAVGAGEAGLRFSVVAAEVRRLASSALEFTVSIKKVVENIQKSTSTMVLMGEEQQKVVAGGVDSVGRMGIYFEHILEMVESTRNATTEINLVTQQQTTASEQMVTSIREVEEIAAQVEKGVKEIGSYMSELKTLADHLKEIIEEKDD